MKFIKKTVAMLLLSMTVAGCFSGCSVKENGGDSTLDIPAMPACYQASDIASMTVNGQDVPVLKFLNNFDHAGFSFSGKADIVLTVHESIDTFSVSPLAKNIEAKADGNTLSFSITQSVYMIVKINGLKELIIAADDIETDAPDSKGEGIYNLVTKYGADPTGEESVTDILQKALNEASAAKGTVYVPAGVYKLDGNILLPSNTDLYMAGGAVMRCTSNGNDYQVMAYKDSISKDVTWLFRTEMGGENFKIRGRGIFDGNGSAMYKDLANTMFYIRQCKNFSMDGVTVRDGNFWTVETKLCDDCTFTNLKILNDFDGMTENDAIDICESRNVLCKHMLAISEDDTYSTKTYTASGASSQIGETSFYNTDDKSYFVLDNVTFDDCFGWTRCGTFKVGDGSNFTQSNVTFKNSYSYKCMQALKVSHAYGGADYVNIVFDNIDIESYGGRGPTDRRWLLVDTFSGTNADPGLVDGLTIKNINIRDMGSQHSTMKGRSGIAKVQGVVFENITVPGLGEGEYASSLAEMNIYDTNIEGTSDYKILPVDNSGTDERSQLAVSLRTSKQTYPAAEASYYTPDSFAALQAAQAEADKALAGTGSVTDALAAMKAAVKGMTDRELPGKDLNLARKKGVAVSGEPDTKSGPARYAVDGNAGTRWVSQSFGGPYTLTVDLGDRQTFNLVYLRWGKCYPVNYKIMVSDDYSTWTEVAVNGQANLSAYKAGNQYLDLSEPVTARYVMLYCVNKAANDGLAVHEFALYNLS